MNLVWLALTFFGAGMFGGREDHAEREVAASILAGRGGEAQVAIKGVDPFSAHVREVDVHASGFTGRGLPLRSEKPNGREGSIGTLHLILDDFQLGILPVLSVDADIHGCRFDLRSAERDRLRLTNGGHGTAIVRVDQDGLAAFIRTKLPGLKNLTVKLGGDRMLLGATADMIKGRPPIYAIGWFECKGTKVNLSKVDLYIDGLPASEATTGAFLALLNPVVDLDRDLGLEGAAYAETLSIANGIAEVRGRIHIPGYVSSR